MNILELKARIDSILSMGMRREALNVVVPVRRIGAIGRMPHVEVTNVYEGIDWDAGMLILATASNLRRIEEDEIARLRQEYDQLGMLVYENRNLKSEIARLRKQLKKDVS